jgi:putative ABC transport system permease protein
VHVPVVVDGVLPLRPERNALQRVRGPWQPSHLCVAARAGTDPGALRERLAAVGGLRAMSREVFAARNQALTRQLLLPIVAIMTAVATAFSVSTVGIALHTSTMERREESGLLGALGMPGRQLYALVLLQTLMAAGVGVVLGVAAAHAMAVIVPLVQPRFVIALPAWLVAAVSAGAVLVSVLAAGRPVRDVARSTRRSSSGSDRLARQRGAKAD